MAETRFGLFHWNASGIYRARDCLKTYRYRNAAEKAASKLYEEDRNSDVVAREFYI